MSATPNVTIVNESIRRRLPDWKDDEIAIVKFNDGSWCTNYGRIHVEPFDHTPALPPTRQVTALDDNTISYIQAICRAGATGYGCDAVRQRVTHTIIRKYYDNIKRKDLERAIAGEVEAEKVMCDASDRLAAYSASQNPGVNQSVWCAVEQLKFGIDSVRDIIGELKNDLAKLN